MVRPVPHLFALLTPFSVGELIDIFDLSGSLILGLSLPPVSLVPLMAIIWLWLLLKAPSAVIATFLSRLA